MVKKNLAIFSFVVNSVWPKFTLQAKLMYKKYCEITIGCFTAMITKHVRLIFCRILWMEIVLGVLQFHMLIVVTMRERC